MLFIHLLSHQTSATIFKFPDFFQHIGETGDIGDLLKQQISFCKVPDQFQIFDTENILGLDKKHGGRFAAKSKYEV